MKRLERLRLENDFPEGVKARVREPRTDLLLLQDSTGRYRLSRARELPYVARTGREIRAFVSDPLDGHQTTSLWNVGSPVWLGLSTPADDMDIADYRGRSIDVDVLSGSRIPVTTRLYLKVAGKSRLLSTFRNARVTPLVVKSAA